MPNFCTLSAGTAALLILSACNTGSECDSFHPLCTTISIANVAATEDGGNAVFTVTLSASAASTVTVFFTTTDGSATAPRDYQARAGTLSFPSGTVMRQITVPLWPDVYDEGPDETFTVVLSAPTGATIANGVATGTITEDDACAPTGTIAVGETVTDDLEGTGCFFPGGEYLDMYLLTLSSATDLLIDQTSDDVDSELYLMETDGVTVDSDDAGGFDMNARIDLTNVPAGDYLVIASSFNAAEAGQYDLSINRVFYGATARNGLVSALYTLDATTGAGTMIGSIGFNDVSAIDFNPLSGVLYGFGERVADSVKVLITIDPTSGAGTEVGPLGIVSSWNVGGMSFRADGAVFLYHQDAGDHTMFTANVTTGVATLLGSTGLSGAGGNGLAFSPSGTLYHSQNDGIAGASHTIDTSTGMASPLATTAGPPTCNSARIGGADFLSGGSTYYGVLKCGSGGSGTAFLAVVDFESGDITEIGPTAAAMDALAIR